jgi:septum formation protein
MEPMPRHHLHSPLILASASPRRAELLLAAGIDFEVVVSPVEEPAHKPSCIPTHLWPICLAYIKASAVQSHLPKSLARKNPLILAADTIVIGPPPRHQILNKPRDRRHARAILSSLSGKRHEVLTGIALLPGSRLRLSSASASCRMKRLSSADLDRYLDSNLWQGKAGAYGIQDPAHTPAHTHRRDPFITLLHGDITTVIGLPIPLLLAELASFAKDP